MSVLAFPLRGLVLVLLAALVSTAAFPASAAPAQQTPPAPLQCMWDRLPPSSTQSVYFTASALDSSTNKLYSYGGIDQSGDAVNHLGVLDLSDADLSKAGFQPVNPSGSRLERYGVAGAYRPKGDDSAIYWIGGAEQDGEATTEVQVFTPKTSSWRKETPLNAQKRVMHAVAYDPVHDVIVVHGGTKACKVANRQPADPPCEGDQLRTQFLKFDSNNDIIWENGPQGGPSQVLGLSMVYDSKRKRMLAYGGTGDGNLAQNRVWALDLSRPDLAQASWTALNPSGAQPQGRFFHSAAYDAAKDMMVINGGVAQMPFTNRENALDDTWALRFEATGRPFWTNLEASVLDRVGGTMAYAPNHMKVILHGGRAQFRTGGSQTVNRDYHALECGAAPTPTATSPSTPVPTPGGPLRPKVCPLIRPRVPAAVINNAVANFTNVSGWGEPANPSIPPGPNNPPRTYLSLLNPGTPWNALSNPLVFKQGCP